jgi:hypothetical protein
MLKQPARGGIVAQPIDKIHGWNWKNDARLRRSSQQGKAAALRESRGTLRLRWRRQEITSTVLSTGR